MELPALIFAIESEKVIIMEIVNSLDKYKDDCEGKITPHAIALIKGIELLDISSLEFHDAEIVRLSINYPEEGDMYAEMDMVFTWGKYSRISWRFIGLITYHICDDGGDRYLYDAGFYTDAISPRFLEADFGSFGKIECLRAEITGVQEFDDGDAPAEKIVRAHYEQGKEGIPCVSTKRMQSF